MRSSSVRHRFLLRIGFKVSRNSIRRRLGVSELERGCMPKIRAQIPRPETLTMQPSKSCAHVPRLTSFKFLKQAAYSTLFSCTSTIRDKKRNIFMLLIFPESGLTSSYLARRSTYTFIGMVSSRTHRFSGALQTQQRVQLLRPELPQRVPLSLRASRTTSIPHADRRTTSC